MLRIFTHCVCLFVYFHRISAVELLLRLRALVSITSIQKATLEKGVCLMLLLYGFIYCELQSLQVLNVQNSLLLKEQSVQNRKFSHYLLIPDVYDKTFFIIKKNTLYKQP